MDVVSEQGVALPFEQGVLLWTMRVWVIGMHHDIQSAARIQDIMERLGAKHASSYLDGFMSAVARGAKRRIAIHCACHPRLEADERILIGVLSLAQEGRSREALLLLRGLVRDDAAKAVLHTAQGLGVELALASHFVQMPHMAESAFKLPYAASPTLH